MAFKTRLRQSKIIKLIEYSCYKMKETSNNSKHEINNKSNNNNSLNSRTLFGFTCISDKLVKSKAKP